MVLLSRFLLFLAGLITLFSVLFHLLMLYEGREFSWITGFYWALTVMSTLGFGDITFQSDLGLVFTIVVLLTGVVCMLIMLPFTFIQFFYEPWLEAQMRSRTPRELPEDTRGHVILTNLDPITQKLIDKLKSRNIDYVLIAADQQQGSDLYDEGYKVVIGRPDDPATYRRIRVTAAAMVIVTGDDLRNTNIAFTIREVTRKATIVTSADNEHSLDILNFPGNIHVFQFMRMLGHSLAVRTVGLGKSGTIVSNFNDLCIAEVAAKRTTFVGRTILEIGLWQQSKTTVVGMLQQGHFVVPTAQTMISEDALLFLAGTRERLLSFQNAFTVPANGSLEEAPVVIIGGGRVGLAAAEKLAEQGVVHTIVEKRVTAATDLGRGNIIVGDAADLNVLQAAGIDKARAVIVTTHNDAMNIYLTFYCRQLRPDIQLICRATNERNVSQLHMAGADLVLSYGSMGANSIMNLLKTDEISMFTEGLSIFSVPVSRKLVGKNLIDSRIRPLTGCSVVAIKSAGEMTVGPDPESPLRAGDEMILIGTTEAEQRFGATY